MNYVLQKYNYALERWLNVKECNTRGQAESRRELCKKKDRGKYRVIKNEHWNDGFRH